MSVTKPFLFLLTIIIFPWQLYAQQYQLPDFKEIELPKPASNDWYQFLQGTGDYKVDTKRGKLKITDYESNDRDRKVELPMNGGTLTGTDEGEFGGQLTFESDDGRSILIKEGDFPFLFIYKRQVYFIDTYGPIRMGKYEPVTEGALYRLGYQNEAYTYEKIFDFDEFPVGMCMVKGDIIVVSYHYLYKIHDLHKEILLKSETMKSDTINRDFSLNSITAIGDQYVYIGESGGYLQFNLTEKSYKYYKYTK